MAQLKKFQKIHICLLSWNTSCHCYMTCYLVLLCHTQNTGSRYLHRKQKYGTFRLQYLYDITFKHENPFTGKINLKFTKGLDLKRHNCAFFYWIYLDLNFLFILPKDDFDFYFSFFKNIILSRGKFSHVGVTRFLLDTLGLLSKMQNYDHKFYFWENKAWHADPMISF